MSGYCWKPQKIALTACIRKPMAILKAMLKKNEIWLSSFDRQAP